MTAYNYLWPSISRILSRCVHRAASSGRHWQTCWSPEWRAAMAPEKDKRRKYFCIKTQQTWSVGCQRWRWKNPSNPTLKKSFVLFSGCLQMTKTKRRHTMKMTMRATRFQTAASPYTASTLNAKISISEKWIHVTIHHLLDLMPSFSFFYIIWAYCSFEALLI